MESQPSDPRPQWSWPEDMAASGAERRSTAAPSSAQGSGTTGTTNNSGTQQGASKKQRHCGPRTCRICLDVVQPSFDVDEGSIPFLRRKTHVRYESEDPELGRLISPCKCKGSQKYVHEGCLQAWRKSAPLSDRNFWRCPTCQYEYRVERLRYGRMLSSRIVRAALTVSVLFFTIFLLGFIADPILNLWLDPFGTITETVTDVINDIEAKKQYYDEPASWSEHFLKGLFSLGLLGFVKAFLAMSPWQWWNARTSGFISGRRRGGRDRLANISWGVVLLGVITFLGAVWKLISHLSARVLEKASERVVDVQEDVDDEEGDDTGAAESRKDI